MCVFIYIRVYIPSSLSRISQLSLRGPATHSMCFLYLLKICLNPNLCASYHWSAFKTSSCKLWAVFVVHCYLMEDLYFAQLGSSF